jgi:hypothetical protein
MITSQTNETTSDEALTSSNSSVPHSSFKKVSVSSKKDKQIKRKTALRDAATCNLQSTYIEAQSNSLKRARSASPDEVAVKAVKISTFNNGFDDENDDYIVRENEMIQQYLVHRFIGKGSFGIVVKATNTLTNDVVAIKIIKNRPLFAAQAESEIEILQFLNSRRDEDAKFIGSKV